MAEGITPRDEAPPQANRSPAARVLSVGARGAERIASATGVDRALEEAIEAAIVRAVHSPAVERAMERALASDQVAEALVTALESAVIDRVWAELLASDKAQMLVERIAEAPEVRAAIAQQGVGLLTDIGHRLTHLTEKLDDIAERIAHGLIGREDPDAETNQVGLITRTLAASIDIWLIALVLSLGGQLIESVIPATRSLSWWIVAAAAVLTGGAILALFWGLIGQTPAMRFLSIQLVVGDSRHIGFRRAVKRVFALPVAALPAGLGFLAILLSDTRQGWHDRIAGTMVVYDTRTEVAPWATLEGRTRPRPPVQQKSGVSSGP